MKSHFSQTIRELPKTKKTQIDELHPLAKIQEKKFKGDEEEHLAEISTIYGSAMGMMIRHERAVLSEPERLPGLRSSFMSNYCHIYSPRIEYGKTRSY